MKTAAFFCALVAVAALLAANRTTFAQDIQFSGGADFSSPLYLQASYDQTTPVTVGGDNCPQTTAFGTGCGSLWRGLEGGVEMTLFNVYANHGVGEANGGNAWFDGGSDMASDMRYWIGWRSQGGLGVRTRYWSYFSNMDEADEFFDVRMFDAEATALMHLHKWTFDGFGGVRWGRIDWTDENGGGVDSAFSFEGVGPTLGVNVRRPIVGCLSFVGGVRGSVLYGDESELTTDDTALGTSYYNTEFRLGLDYRRQMRNGHCLSLGVAWENQLYSSLSVNVDDDIDPEDIDVTLAGPTIWIGFER